MEALESLNVSLQQLLVMITGLDAGRVVLADQGRPAPKGKTLYCTYRPYPIRAYGHPSKHYTEVPAIEESAETGWTDLEERVITSLVIMVSVNFYNEGAADAAWKMLSADRLETVTQHLFLNNLNWRKAGPVRNLTAMQRADVQPRYQLDIDMIVRGEQANQILAAGDAKVAMYDENDNPL